VEGAAGNDREHPEWRIESGYGQVAWIMAENCDEDTQVRADADLIAAAPDLLEALVDLLRETSNGCEICAQQFVDAARGAIAKAGGQSTVSK
jgi:hypothetical protein